MSSRTWASSETSLTAAAKPVDAGLVDGVGVDVGDEDGGAEFLELVGDGQADAVGSGRDQNALGGEIHEFSLQLVGWRARSARRGRVAEQAGGATGQWAAGTVSGFSVPRLSSRDSSAPMMHMPTMNHRPESLEPVASCMKPMT